MLRVLPPQHSKVLQWGCLLLFSFRRHLHCLINEPHMVPSGVGSLAFCCGLDPCVLRVGCWEPCGGGNLRSGLASTLLHAVSCCLRKSPSPPDFPFEEWEIWAHHWAHVRTPALSGLLKTPTAQVVSLPEEFACTVYAFQICLPYHVSRLHELITTVWHELITT